MVVCCGLALGGSAQFFSQNSSRIKDYEEQIGEMEAYLAVAAKGFSVVQSGLQTIQEAKQGEFGLHEAFYGSLGEINPAVSGLAEVAEITALDAATVRRFSAVLARPGLGGSDLAAIGEVYAAVVSLCLADVVELTEVLTSGDLTMTDDQRVSRIDVVYRGALARYRFAVSYTDQAALLAGQRSGALSEIGLLKGLY